MVKWYFRGQKTSVSRGWNQNIHFLLLKGENTIKGNANKKLFTIRYYNTGCVRSYTATSQTQNTLKYCTVIMRHNLLNTAHLWYTLHYLTILHSERHIIVL